AGRPPGRRPPAGLTRSRSRVGTPGGAAPHAHRRPARWRSRGRPEVLAGARASVPLVGLRPTPIDARLAGARAVVLKCSLALALQYPWWGCAPRPSTPGSLALARSS